MGVNKRSRSKASFGSQSQRLTGPHTKRRQFLKALGKGAAISLVGAAGGWTFSCSKSERDAPPNILILLADDQRFDTIGALNNPEIETPYLDRLVKRGITFTRAHIMGGTSGAVCIPSRAMLLTGKTLFHLENRGGTIPEDHVMLPEIFKEAGYRTYGVGKWHNGRKAFARCFTGGGPVFFGGMTDHLQVPIYDFDPEGEYPTEKQKRGDRFSSELFSDAAVRLIKEDPGDRPFFLYVSYTAPHDPRMAPEEFSALYPPAKIPLPPNFLPRHPFDNGEMTVRDEQLAPFPRTAEIIRDHIGAYYAMITHLDAQIGRILEALEESGKADNTIIIFAGDNGLAVGQHGLLGKQNIYDHSVRIPLMISGPEIPVDVRRDSLCYLLDLYPTLCDLVGQPRPEGNEGVSLLPVLKKSGRKIRDSLFLAYTRIHRGVRTDDDWKLIEYNVDGTRRTQLFNLRRDPWEMHNLAEEAVHKDRLEELRFRLSENMREYDDFCDFDKPHWGLPLEIKETVEIKHIAAGRKIANMNGAAPKYAADGIKALVDGLRGTLRFSDGYWVGLEGEDLDVQIDLARMRPVRKVTVGFLENQNSWIFFPLEVEFLLSEDGARYRSLAMFTNPLRKNEFAETTRDFVREAAVTTARWIRIKARGIRICPEWHPGAGKKAWLFVDEVVVE